MSDFDLQMGRGTFRFESTSESFRPSGTLKSPFWEVYWVASQQSTTPGSRFEHAISNAEPQSLLKPWDFAFVAKHKTRKLWIISRDALGLVPVRYTAIPGGVRWFTGPHVGPHQVNRDRLQTFTQFVPDFSREEFFSDVYRLLPGEAVVADGYASHSQNTFAPQRKPITDDAVADILVRTLELHTPTSDAYTLSGGLDSTALVALAGPKAKAAWTVRYPEAVSDETGEAKQTALELGVPWHDVDATPFPALHSPSFFKKFPNGFGPWFVPATQTEVAFFEHIARNTTGEIVVGVGADQVLHSNADVAIREALRAGNSTYVLQELRRNRRRSARQIAVTGIRALNQTQQTDWANIRRQELNAWAWELTVRQLELYSRQIGRPFATPWLNVDLWDAMLRATPAQLRSNGVSKGIARDALKGKIPEQIRTAAKRKGPNKFVERGLAIDGRETVTNLFENPRLPSYVDVTSEKLRRDYTEWVEEVVSNYPDGPFQPTLPIWRKIGAEFWLRSLVE